MTGAGFRTAAIAVLVGVPACAPEDDPPVAIEVLGEDVEMALLDMDTYLTREGVRRARLRADTAEFIGDGEVHMRPVELTFYDRVGNEMSVITADFGVFHEMTEDMEAEGSVVALDRRDDQRLETDRIRYEAEADRLFGDEAFTLYRDRGATVIRGSAFETDPGLSSILMFDSSGRTQQTSQPAAQTVPPADPGAPPAGAPDSASDQEAAPVSDSTTVENAAGDTTEVVAPDTTGAARDTSNAAADTLAAPDSIRNTRG